eukprot:Gb_40661 [translate_table: standard]
MFAGTKKDNGVVAINTDNIFAALESRKKKSGKKKESNKDAKKATQFWTNAPVTVKSWADCEDDDDYFASAPPPVWGKEQSREQVEADKEESDDQEEDDIDEEADEEIEERQENDAESSLDAASGEPLVLQVNKTREPEKQLSKKEIKKKELAELDKVLAEFGLLTKEANGTNESQEKKTESEAKEVLECKPSRPILAESKTTKKRKAKKEKFKEEEVGTTANGNEQDQIVDNKLETNAVVADPKAVLKKLVSQQKKKSGKESDTAAKAAAAEAAARAAKQAAAKKKDKMHYNQHPPK